MKIQKFKKIAAISALCALTSTSSFATLFTASSGDRSASADFQDLGGNQLQVTLANTYSGNTANIAHVLYSFFFTGATGLTLISVDPVASGTYYEYLHQDPSDEVQVTSSDELANIAGVSNVDGWSQNGNGASALGHGQQSLGLVSAGFSNPGGSGNGGLLNANHNPYLKNSIVLLFDYTTLGDISNVQFKYNTEEDITLNGTNTTPSIPEPSTIVAGVLLLLPFGVSTIRILRKSRQA